MSKYSQEQLAVAATVVIEDLERGDGRKARMLIEVLRGLTGLSRRAILAKLHGLTVGVPT